MQESTTLLSMVQGVDLGDIKTAVMAAGALAIGLVVTMMGVNKVKGMLAKG